jgi:hypothetical protein
MTYAQGGLIEAGDYNGFVASVNAIWGTGTGNAGYGQSSLSTVAQSNAVTAVQWTTLIDTLNKISRHQSGGTPTGLANVNTGDIITYLSTLSSSIGTLTTNRNTINAASINAPVAATAMVNSTAWYGGTPGVNGAVKEVKYSFPSGANAMRHFFNTGGYVTFTGINSAFSGNTKSDDWETLVNNCGTIQIKGTSAAKNGGGGSPSVLNTSLGYHGLTSSYQTILQQFSPNAIGGYTSNYAIFEARLNAAVGSATEIFLKMSLFDGSGDTVFPADQVLGSVRLDYSYATPITTYLSNVWGAVNAATVTDTQT